MCHLQRTTAPLSRADKQHSNCSVIQPASQPASATENCQLLNGKHGNTSCPQLREHRAGMPLRPLQVSGPKKGYTTTLTLQESETGVPTHHAANGNGSTLPHDQLPCTNLRPANA